jgi:hypothetical protein
VLTFPDRCERDAGFVFRYKGENQAYLAGLGGWDSRYFVAKMYREKDWKLIDKTGDSQSLEHETSFSLRVDFDGASIRLFHNDMLQLEVEDSTYVSGRMGLFASRAKVTFSEVQISQKTCFTVMPFHPDFDPVYDAIKRAADVKDIACIRSDEIVLSRPVATELVHDIGRADIVVIDLTDRNSNVYYEAGLAHALGKQYILIAESKEAHSFDVGYLNALFYGNRTEPKNLQQDLAKWFDKALDDTRA